MTAEPLDVTDPDYWRARGLDPPNAVEQPDSVRALRRRIAAASERSRPTLIAGAGTQLRPAAVTAEPFDLVVTTGCDRIQSIDPTSGTVTLEAGVRWGELRDRLREEELPFAPKGLYAADATIGGLLCSGRASELGPDVAAMTACTASGNDYRYAEAPRKAAGPDMRYLFMGCEGAFGVILTVTLALGAQQDARLWRISGRNLKGKGQPGSELIERLADRDIRPAWTWMDPNADVLDVAVHGPEQLLERWHAAASDVLSSEQSLEVLDAEACRHRRDAIETEELPLETEELPFERTGAREVSARSEWPEWLRYIKGSLDGAGSLATGPRPSTRQPTSERDSGGNE